MLKVENIVKIFSDLVAVNNVSFHIDDGEVFGFLGPNGAGKTTTVKIISGLIKPTSGNAYLDKIDIIKNPIEAKKNISYIPDEPFVYPYLTGREFLNFIAEVYSIKDYEKDIENLLDIFSLTQYADKLLGSYSHGMRQKILILSAILRKPRLMLFDEPTVGLDPMSVKKFKDIIKMLTKNGVSVFICTHILELAEKICDRVCVINNGKILKIGTINEFTSSKSKDFEQAFFEILI